VQNQRIVAPGLLMRFLFFVVLNLIAIAAYACDDDPYRQLRDAYAAADADAAARAYASDAVYQELYPGAAPVQRSGREAIAAHFAALFDTLGLRNAGAHADLDFKRSDAVDGPASLRSEAGFYRLTVTGADGRRQSYDGKFAVQLRDCQFFVDTSSASEPEEYDTATPAPMFGDVEAGAARAGAPASGER
jgi:ketosteroid isomerase-like protein